MTFFLFFFPFLVLHLLHRYATLSNAVRQPRCLDASMSFKILACGSNGSFQLGTGDNDDRSLLTPVKLPTNSIPVQFAFGGNHTLILCQDGHVFAAGDNQYGQCGIDGVNTIHNFIEIPGKWSKIAAGWEFSVLCSVSGDIYTCGHGPKGELGLGRGITKQNHPTCVEIPDLVVGVSITDIKASISHALVKYDNGVFIGWGACRKGQLGVPQYEENSRGVKKPMALIWQPQTCNLTGTKFCLGRDRTILYGDRIDIVGQYAESIHVSPTKVRAMWSSIHYSVQGKSGLILKSVGNNLHGQLFNYNSPGGIIDFEVGSEHGVVLLENGSVYAWGWGEHGNCGEKNQKNPNDSDSVTFNYLNQIYAGQRKVVHMACGLATTWLVLM